MLKISSAKISLYLTILLIIVSSIFVVVVTRPVGSSEVDYSQYSSKVIYEEHGTQIIGIKAGLGFYPNKILAQSNVPTTLRFQTQNTFDCSEQVLIPQLNIRQSLPFTGTSDISIPPQPSGTDVIGYCSANTYKFDIRFS